jgi:hypothetical protein
MTEVPRRRFRLALMAALAGVVILGAVAVFWLRPGGQPTAGAPQPTAGESSGGPRPSSPSTDRFPTERTTGVRAGVTLRDSGSITVDQPGSVIEGLRVSGHITIRADDVVVRDTLVLGGGAHYPIRVASGVSNALIEHVEVDNGQGGIGIFFNGGSGTVRAANVHSSLDGIRIQANNVTIEDSYVHDLVRQAGGHHDTIQIRSGDDVTIRGNTLLPYVASTGDPMNAAIQIGSLQRGPLERLTVEGNYMDGGNYTIHGADGIGSGTFVGNVFGPHARYGIRSGMSDAIVWEGNTMDGTGEPAR